MNDHVKKSIEETVKGAKETIEAAFGAVKDGFAAKDPGVIRNQGLLDLSSAKGPEDIAHLRRLENVGLVLVPESLATELTKVPMENVGATVNIPAGGRIRTYTGQLKLAGDCFAKEAGEDDVIVIAGQVVFTTPVTEIKAKEVVVAGQVVAPKSSESTLAASVTHLAGQLLYYADGAKPRIVIGQDDFAKAFFDYLREPEVLVLIGQFDFADDVTPEVLRDKLAGLLVVGETTCSGALKPALQALCDECIGTIKAR